MVEGEKIKNSDLDDSPIDVAKKEDWDNSFKNEFFRKVYLRQKEGDRYL